MMRAAFALPTLATPKSGGMFLPVALDFSASGTLEFDFWLNQATGASEFFQSIYIKNRPNANPLTVTFPQTGYSIRVLSGQQGDWPLLVPKNVALRFTVTTTPLAAVLLLILKNTPYQPMVLA